MFFLAVILLFYITYLSKCFNQSENHCKIIIFRDSVKRIGTTYRNIKNYDFKYPPILMKIGRKVVFHRFYQTCLIIIGGKIGGEIGEKMGRLLKIKIVGVWPTDFQATPTDFFNKNRPTTTNFLIFGCLWKSVGKIVWWELGFRLRIMLPGLLLCCL